MALAPFKQRSFSGGSAGISPIGYYRLGQSYPRTEARQPYPLPRRVILSQSGALLTLIDPHSATIGPIPLSLAANAVVRLRVKRRAGADTHYTMPEGSSLTVRGEL